MEIFRYLINIISKKKVNFYGVCGFFYLYINCKAFVQKPEPTVFHVASLFNQFVGFFSIFLQLRV
ncbi:hypothetical protein C5167_020962 [Papaver somniferum]|uniref:Uncharacterized protein n=1 Tax=Papaver somniferum TaxID=3469 RepID=A0A4Y7IWK6_PAPSO|nr:hypothetical protein C5167_020962 [Papaver somniferum]